ncbi:uncharacterized protein BDZ99DRAFT_476635 [Mytilinidion resinicola]|uniref:Pre-mRNA-processing factor 39 n=1 Tax=Mytilinidion resinicola TaxID=574789 RepID=A0A6A6YR85_9PEZI|nr:uncharacterized protein BDZ99DRAFT_476635 [Mytilinidion resinicola]KAF2810475.1 hypothetical protein BDZ99DRAFT_476635 [Mytilinidion resinicola]
MVYVKGSVAEVPLGGSDEENIELKKLVGDVVENEDEYDGWEKLVRAAEALEGGLNRNSSPQAIAFTREIYNRFLAKFPLFFGYWKKYADLEFSIAGTEAADMVYERGVASITNSVDLWMNYCAFKVDTCHNTEEIRELFERGAMCVGLDFLAHPFWDKYIEFEERLEAHDKIFAILGRIINIPMHQYSRYFERYRNLAASRPLNELVYDSVLVQFRTEVELDVTRIKSELEIERELRARIDNFHLEIFQRTQTETTKRWTYEQEIKRPYFHVTELDETQLVNWRKYLDFEEAEGDFTRTVFLYERCLVAAAYYEEFWLRFARWMYAQEGKEEEVRNIYARASALYVPISRPAVRLQYARFEESTDRIDVSRAIHEAILDMSPGHLETIISWANLERRQEGLDAAINVYKTYIESQDCGIYVQGAMVAEWARLLWKIKGSVDEARQVFKSNEQYYLDVPAFWVNYLQFELQQPTSAATEAEHYERIKQLHRFIRSSTRLASETIKEISQHYMTYLLERGTKDAVKNANKDLAKDPAAKEYMKLDREANGRSSRTPAFGRKRYSDKVEVVSARLPGSTFPPTPPPMPRSPPPLRYSRSGLSSRLSRLFLVSGSIV